MTNTTLLPGTLPTPSAAAADPLRERSRRIWSAGDYDRVSAGFREGAEAFVARRQLRAGQRVLDAACGSGNLTIPAARTGAAVAGLDLVPSLLADARRWAADEGLAVVLEEGDVEALPYGDAQFDVVMSMFGVMFAARPERVVAELARVTRPGGQVALANWTRAGFTGKMLAMHAAMVPPPAGVPSPLLWADEDALRALFDERTWRLTTMRRTLSFRYPHTPAGTAELFRGTYGPTVRTFEALDEDRRATFAADLAAHWARHQRAQGAATEVEAEYLEVVAVRR
ncbi:class I SAM-dependent methyltransferase [Roseisolibacter sp. H3M3-2]|uniref:class I SAM-dependent methyltransferase n=1 Tax=Roseisolibacter sp. H3M3-2 TaxID=3031323 RepID=UPI0023DA335C|nr:class I SAM-dependent methyltransferase [Roseisolibacter sp. H3M3-2]MDF1503273.1 class I SAM-dependent methyltransferase [Roseisolibacter sp. H3M3-2]